MGKAAVVARTQCRLARVPEGGMSQIVPQRRRLGQILIEPQGTCHGTRDLRNLQRMRQPGTVMVACRSKEHLRFVHKTPERLTVNDTVPVALILRPHRGRCLRTRPSA